MDGSILMERAIILPFSVDSTGSILSSNDPRLIWQSRVTAAVLTGVGERIFRPKYGGFIKSILFEPSADADYIIKESVTGTFTSYLPDLTLVNITTSMDSQLSTISVTIDYKLPNGQFDQVSIKTGFLTRSGDVIQE
jgi:phage baseplate assembly protein W